MGKYAESKKRRKNRRKLAKSYYSLCIRNSIDYNDHMRFDDDQIKSKYIIIDVLNRLLISENMNNLMSTITRVFITTYHLLINKHPLSCEIFASSKEKTIREHIIDYIFEQRCMIHSKLPKDMVRMLYTFL